MEALIVDSPHVPSLLTEYILKGGCSLCSLHTLVSALVSNYKFSFHVTIGKAEAVKISREVNLSFQFS